MTVDLALIDTGQSILDHATDPQQTMVIEAAAKAAQAWAKEQNDYEMLVKFAKLYIMARRATTLLSMPFAPNNGGDRKSSEYQNNNDVNLISDFAFTPMQWHRRVKELELTEDEIEEYFDECIAKQWQPTLFGLWRYRENPEGITDLAMIALREKYPDWLHRAAYKLLGLNGSRAQAEYHLNEYLRLVEEG